MPVFRLSDAFVFPPPRLAGNEGLLAWGGDLRRERLLLAYRMGIFPWFSEGEPILWWSPDPRLILYPSEFRAPASLKKKLRKEIFRVTLDTAFESVIAACAEARSPTRRETWIVPEMIDAYCRLHADGYAHSVEVWDGENLAGGLYGVSLGGCFFGESMFTKITDASKVALVRLAEFLERHAFDMIDCQVRTDHLIRFGAREIPRSDFLMQLERSLRKPTLRGGWSFGATAAQDRKGDTADEKRLRILRHSPGRHGHPDPLSE